jgi:hypothetical protein
MNFPQTPNLFYYQWEYRTDSAARALGVQPANGNQVTKNKRLGVWGKFFSPSLQITRFARAKMAWNSTCVPASASSGSMLSASLCESPSLQGVKIIAVGTERAT